MIVFDNIEDIYNHLWKYRKERKQIGLVPTMGRIHDGHLSLIENSKEISNIQVTTIYINKLQFDNREDFKSYPRNYLEDEKVLNKSKCDILYLPKDEQIYPNGTKELLKLNFGRLDSTMEGMYRKGHFNGVGTIITKLLNIIQPNTMHVGQKDLQQYLIIKKLIEDFGFLTNVICCKTIREKDGLAMASRNKLLQKTDRLIATYIYKSLFRGKKKLLEGKSISEAKANGIDLLNEFPSIEIDYFEIVNKETLIPASDNKNIQELCICTAIWINGKRLIDNIFVED